MPSRILAYPKIVKGLDYLKDIAIRRYIAMQATHDLWNNYFVLPEVCTIFVVYKR